MSFKKSDVSHMYGNKRFHLAKMEVQPCLADTPGIEIGLFSKRCGNLAPVGLKLCVEDAETFARSILKATAEVRAAA